MSLTILIVDDNHVHSSNLEMICAEIGHNNTYIASNLQEARKSLSNHSIDIVLLDMHLGNELGADLYDDLNKSFTPFVIITSFSDEKIYNEASDSHPEAFLIKPVNKLTLKSILDKVKNGFDNESIKYVNEGFFVKVKNKFKKISYNDLIIIKAEGNYVTLFTLSQRLTIRSTLKNLVAKITNEDLFRIHRSYIVNLKFVSDIDFANNVMTINNKEVGIGKNYKAALKSKIKEVS